MSSKNMHHLIVLFDNETTAYFLATALLHITLAIFTAAVLTKFSPAVWALVHEQFSRQQKRKPALLYYENRLYFPIQLRDFFRLHFT